MHTLAKRIHNITPRDVRLTFDDDSQVTLAMRSAEFFQEAFRPKASPQTTSSTGSSRTFGNHPRRFPQPIGNL